MLCLFIRIFGVGDVELSVTIGPLAMVKAFTFVTLAETVSEVLGFFKDATVLSRLAVVDARAFCLPIISSVGVFVDVREHVTAVAGGDVTVEHVASVERCDVKAADDDVTLSSEH